MEDFTARQEFKAREEGKIEGKKEGRREGKIEGKIEGEMETKEKTARRMIAKGMDHAEIAELVGLTVAEVEGLAEGDE
jgi:predicted transposase/invertase (TIGR01784 family)